MNNQPQQGDSALIRFLDKHSMLCSFTAVTAMGLAVAFWPETTETEPVKNTVPAQIVAVSPR